MIKRFTEQNQKTVYLDGIAYDVLVRISGHIDTQWGADADGNRYAERHFIDDVEVLSAYDGDGQEVTNKKVLDELSLVII